MKLSTRQLRLTEKVSTMFRSVLQTLTTLRTSQRHSVIVTYQYNVSSEFMRRCKPLMRGRSVFQWCQDRDFSTNCKRLNTGMRWAFRRLHAAVAFLLLLFFFILSPQLARKHAAAGLSIVQGSIGRSLLYSDLSVCVFVASWLLPLARQKFSVHRRCRSRLLGTSIFAALITHRRHINRARQCTAASRQLLLALKNQVSVLSPHQTACSQEHNADNFGSHVSCLSAGCRVQPAVGWCHRRT
jgi:hypothetical protein